MVSCDGDKAATNIQTRHLSANLRDLFQYGGLELVESKVADRNRSNGTVTSLQKQISQTRLSMCDRCVLEAIQSSILSGGIQEHLNNII